MTEAKYEIASIRQLQVGEPKNPGTDIYVYPDGFYGVVELNDPASSSHFYRISLAQLVAEPASEAKLQARITELETACRAVLEAIERADLNGEVLWIKPPYQYEFVHESATERLQQVLDVPASEAKREALEAAGWKTGDAADFLNMSDEERKQLDERMASETPSKPNPGEGWRLLEDGEKIHHDDEVFMPIKREWTRTIFAGSMVGKHPTNYTYRRRIPAPASVPSVEQPSLTKTIETMQRLIGELKTEQQTNLAELADLKQTIEQYELARKEMQARNEHMLKNWIPGDSLFALTAERDDLRKQLEIAQQTGNELAAKLEEVKAERDRIQGLLSNEQNAYDVLKAELATIKQRLIEYRDYVGADGGPERLRGIQGCLDYVLTKAELAAAKQPQPVEYAWRDARPEDCGKGYQMRVRDFSNLEWSLVAGQLIAYNSDAPMDMCWQLDRTRWKFCQVYAPVETEAAKPAPQEEWRELSKNDQYSGPGQVTDDDPADGEQEWSDAMIMGIDPNCKYPFVAKRNEYNAYCGFEFARVRREVSHET